MSTDHDAADPHVEIQDRKVHRFLISRGGGRTVMLYLITNIRQYKCFRTSKILHLKWNYIFHITSKMYWSIRSESAAEIMWFLLELNNWVIITDAFSCKQILQLHKMPSAYSYCRDCTGLCHRTGFSLSLGAGRAARRHQAKLLS